MSASDPMFPGFELLTDGQRVIVGSPHGGCSTLLYCMVHAPASEILRMQLEVKHGVLGVMDARRAWAEALIKESER